MTSDELKIIKDVLVLLDKSTEAWMRTIIRTGEEIVAVRQAFWLIEEQLSVNAFDAEECRKDGEREEIAEYSKADSRG